MKKRSKKLNHMTLLFKKMREKTHFAFFWTNRSVWKRKKERNGNIDKLETSDLGRLWRVFPAEAAAYTQTWRTFRAHLKKSQNFWVCWFCHQKWFENRIGWINMLKITSVNSLNVLQHHVMPATDGTIQELWETEWQKIY